VQVSYDITVKNPSMSLSLTLNKNEKVKQYIKKKIINLLCLLRRFALMWWCPKTLWMVWWFQN